ncbi:MAG: M48 family metalloprotease [Chitinophagaceae bacterium]|nr:M48 family metalloprotease [Chitinophagaceae bacterium]
MKKYFFRVLPVLLFFFSVPAFLQAAAPSSTAIVSTENDEAREIINDIIAVVGLKPNFEVQAMSKIDNAAAVTYNGKRFIVYNPQFITNLNIAAGNKWAAVSVLAHEIGHHLNGHTLSGQGSLPALELEADEFSGFVLQKMGATLSQAQAAMKIAGNYKESLTHPAGQDRLAAIQKGWNRATAANPDLAKYNKPVPPAERQQALASRAQPMQRSYQERGYQENNNSMSAANTVLDSRYVFAKVDFPSDRSANYYVTTRYNVVKVANGQMYVLGKMMRTDNETYPYVLKVGEDEDGTLFVERSGKIVTSRRQLAGYLRI